MSNALSADYWSQRYRENRTGWDLHVPNSGLVAAVKARLQPSARILIPGAGRGYEAEALWDAGYDEVYVCDWAEEAFEALRSASQHDRVWLAKRLIVGDFFELDDKFDAIVEQTFFCALDPGKRAAYVEQCARLLCGGGSWIGILFDRYFPTPGPPFGGGQETYKTLFEPSFSVLEWKPFTDSVAPRLGAEWFGVLRSRSVC